MRFRDRDAPITDDGLIFRTYGYDHPPDSCFCDLEYAPETLYRTDDPRAVRDGLPRKYYKFYFDGGLKFALICDPPFKLLHKSLRVEMVGVDESRISRVVRPQQRLQELMETESDPLTEACEEVLNLVTDSSSLKRRDFGVFGSLAHGFHNPRYSDIDFTVYGKKQLAELRQILGDLYGDGNLRNEFEDWSPRDPPAHWNFTHYSKEEYGRSQLRKGIYTTYDSKTLNRWVKVEFEPVRRWDEVTNNYGAINRITSLGRVEATGEILAGDEGGFMPSVYPTRLLEISGDVDCGDILRIVSYIEEFRLQFDAGDTALIRGNLERVEGKDRVFHQITLSYGADYFDQVLKSLEIPR